MGCAVVEWCGAGVPCVVRGVRGTERYRATVAAARGQRARSTGAAGRPGAARAGRTGPTLIARKTIGPIVGRRAPR